MKSVWIKLAVPMALLLLFFLACSNSDQVLNSPESEFSEEQLSLDKEFGGFTTEDEAPGFNDPEFATDFQEDAEVADPMNSDMDVVNDLNSSAIKAFFVRVTWGHLEGDSTATETVDWSGSIEVNKGTLLVLRAIRFERSDKIKFPRDSRTKIEFTSKTKRHFDGLALAILDNDTSNAEIEGTLTLNLGAYTKVLSFSELDSLDLIESVDDAGNEVSIVSRSKDIVPFRGGFVSGRWIKTRPNGGIFKGRWINSLGTNAGHVRGIWGVNRNGRRVFFGKFISLNGKFRGLLKGTWEFKRGDRGGEFRGHWVDRNHDVQGILRGHFKTGRPGDRRGFFHGRWKVKDGQTDEATNS